MAPIAILLFAPEQRVRATDLLDLYLKGEHAAAVAPLANVTNVRNLALDLEADGEDWIKKGKTPEDLRRRRLAAASLVLELAVLRMDDEWFTLQPLIEWGCVQLRTDPPSDAELAWHRAAFAVIQGARDATVDVPYSSQHAAHVSLRFPKDPVVAFARGFFAEFQVPVEGRLRLIDVDTAAMFSARAVEAYREASVDPEIAHESSLAIGYIQLRMKKLDAVLPELATAAQSRDRFVRYLAHLFRGRALEQLGGNEEAAAAYRAALSVMPNAQSAAVSLAALLHLSDQTDAAIALMTTSFAARPSEDPWREYGFGLFRHWTRYRDRMREAAR